MSHFTVGVISLSTEDTEAAIERLLAPIVRNFRLKNTTASASVSGLMPKTQEKKPQTSVTAHGTTRKTSFGR